ncbi:MAG: diadenylate cyclase [Candidatus Methanoperedens sp.]|nr:diadenylate cyclase [Candidatus Methanoperedens sp.]MCZ7369058.1 diadenylate cyclase [Candidatus Methanoperedens sp.]
MLLNNPKKKAQSIIRKIERGTASGTDIINLSEILNKEPSLVPETAGSLISILKKFDTISFKSAISALNVVADKDTGIISDSVNLIASCLQKDLHTGEILKTLEIMHKIYQKHPEKMNIAVPGLLLSLRNMNVTVRENAYYLLGSIAILHPEFFKGHTRELNLALNGLNLDERIYACKIIKNIADKDPTIVEDAYDILSYLQSNHPSHELRIKAASAMDKLKIKEEVPKVREDVIGPEDNKTTPDLGGLLLGIGQQVKSEFAGILETEKKDKKEMLNAPGLEYFIQRKENMNISSQVEKIISGADIKSPVLESVFNIAVEISREGREGKPVGTAFIIGNSKDVLARSKQLIHNPVEGIPKKERMITDPEFSNTIKELAQLDGVFVIGGDGLVEAACRFLTADASMVDIPKGLGTKHFSVAAMTMATKAIGIVVSESGGRITLFKNGKILSSFS